MFCGGVQIREGGPNPLADMDRGGPNPLADLDRGVQIRGGSKSAVTPAYFEYLYLAYLLSRPAYFEYYTAIPRRGGE